MRAAGVPRGWVIRSVCGFFLAALLLLPLTGCSSSEQYSSILVTTDLPAGTTVMLQAESTTVSYYVVTSAAVDASGQVHFAHVTPGEYRLVAVNAAGMGIRTSPPFGVGFSETHVSFLATGIGP